jgi:DNA-binding GntR family transcriptional regulator
MQPESDLETTLVGRALRSLREEILSGELGSGARIHLEEAAARLGMSPIPIREALRILASEGLVTAVRNRGYRVTATTVEDLDDTYLMRLTLDPMAVRLAVPRFTDADRAGLQASFEQLLQSYRQDDWTAHRIHHRAFHFAIYQACGSPWLLRFISMLWETSDRYQRLSTALRGTKQQRIEEHREIYDACMAGDADEAGRAMEKHLGRTHRTVRDLLETLRP